MCSMDVVGRSRIHDLKIEADRLAVGGAKSDLRVLRALMAYIARLKRALDDGEVLEHGLPPPTTAHSAHPSGRRLDPLLGEPAAEPDEGLVTPCPAAIGGPDGQSWL